MEKYLVPSLKAPISTSSRKRTRAANDEGVATEKFMDVVAACQRLRVILNDERDMKDSVLVALNKADSELRTLKSKKTKGRCAQGTWYAPIVLD